MSRDPLESERDVRDDWSQEAAREPNAAAQNLETSGGPPHEVRTATENDPQKAIQDSSRTYYLRSRAYSLRESAFETLREIGRFRVIDTTDLTELGYSGDQPKMRRDLRHLEQHGLVAPRALGYEAKGKERLVVLTKKGRSLLLKSGRVSGDQALYDGFVKRREARHDASLYRLYQREAERIVRAGGKPTRVVLDYELKRKLYRHLATLEEEGQTLGARTRVAAAYGLVVVNGRVRLPDLRLEYETADHEHKHTDLELATRNYRPRALEQVVKAGFSVYALRDDAAKLQRILDRNELTARILAL